MKAILSKLKVLLIPSFAAEGEMLSDSARKHWLDVLDKHGITAHFYMASCGYREDTELSNALDRLNAAGYIFTDTAGHLVGRIAKARLSSQEIAELKRADFKIID